ncbi:MAG: ADOP family duplicated permease [Bryobacteraceae bacterium]
MRFLVALRRRCRSFFRKQDADRELHDELRFHFEREVEQGIVAGLSPQEARRAAKLSFGPVTTVEEECRDARGVRFFENIVQDLRYAARGLWQQPLLVFAATLSLALGIGVNTAIFSLGDDFLLQSPSVREPGQVVRIWMGHGSDVSYREWKDLRESGALAGIAGYQIERQVNWRNGDETRTLTPLIVTANFFDVLGVPVALGRGFTAKEAEAEHDPAVAVVSDGFWRSDLGADPGILGQSLILNGRPYTVLGVLPKHLRSAIGFDVAPQVYLPLSKQLMPDLDAPRSAAVMLIGRLKAGQSLTQGRAELTAAGMRLGAVNKDKDFGHLLEFSPAKGFGQAGAVLPDAGAFFVFLLIVVGLVLIIACANVAGLLLARSTVRQREIAVRLALGASRGRLVQQLLTESLWLAVLGTGCGLVLCIVLMRVLNGISLPIPIPLELNLAPNLKLLAYASLLALISTLLCGLAPALRSTRPDLIPALKQQEIPHLHRRLTVRKLLVMGQVCVSVVLLVTAVLFLHNLGRTTSLNPGFDTHHVLTAEITPIQDRYTPQSQRLFERTVLDRLRALPGVQSAACAYGVPLTVHGGRSTGTDLQIEGRSQKFHAEYAENFISPGYFETLQIPLLSGRDFRENDGPGAAPVAVVNEEFARRYLRGMDPIGLRLTLPGFQTSYSSEIVGVVANSKYRTIGERQRPAIYEPYGGQQARIVEVVVRTAGPPGALVHAVRSAIAHVDPTAAADVRTMRQALAFAFLPSQIGAALLGSLGGLGVLLAMLGLYAVIGYSVSRRTREIGIRMALGSSSGAVLRLILRDAIVVTGVGLCAGLGIAWFITRPIGTFLVAGLSFRDPLSYLATALLLGIAALAASVPPARRAAKVDPMEALRFE